MSSGSDSPDSLLSNSPGVQTGTAPLAVGKSLLPQTKLLWGTMNFQELWDDAHHDMSRLDPPRQVACAIFLALASVTSDHPLLVGDGAPRSSMLHQLADQGVDLSPYGRRRQFYCVHLRERAIDMGDKMGRLYTSSVTTIALLHLLEALMGTNTDSEAGLGYSALATGHAKALLERESDRPEKKLSNTTLGYLAYMKDAMRSAKRNRPPAFSDEDVYRLREGRPPPPSLLEALLSPPRADVQDQFWHLFDAFLSHEAESGIQSHANLTGLFARRATHLDELFVDEYLKRISLSFFSLPTIRQTAEQLFRSDFEEGGSNVEWDFATKTAELTWVLKAVGYVSWAYPDLAASQPLVVAAVRKVERAHSEYRISQAAFSAQPIPHASPSIFMPGFEPFLVENELNTLLDLSRSTASWGDGAWLSGVEAV
ncbi:Zn(2)-C7 fungal-type transcription factor [Pseudohyphozyma bogoriensis]|nr:Zn(2)-C7 fungal-type transcription factor [Pseudohyphozyma bogoriensis]